MPVYIDEIVADVKPEPGDEPAGGGGGEQEPEGFCVALQRARLALERRERLRVD